MTRGVRDSSNRNSLWYPDAAPVTIGEKFRFKFPTMPTEHTSRPATRSRSSSPAPTPSDVSGTGNDNVAVTLDTRTSKVTLPIVGGYAAAAVGAA